MFLWIDSSLYVHFIYTYLVSYLQNHTTGRMEPALKKHHLTKFIFHLQVYHFDFQPIDSVYYQTNKKHKKEHYFKLQFLFTLSPHQSVTSNLTVQHWTCAQH